ncbi:MAG: N-6 DNA methylase [Bacteroidales bacterium]|nr:N-6 DNA methylase [Bacteroidales bacterium]
MLDSETKNRINTARDILVGKVPDPKSQVEQITIALIYKFMDDMDVESEEMGGKRTFFCGEYAKYSWRKIFDPRQSGHELLNLYSEAIAKMDTNPGVPKLFRDIFKNAYLPYRDPETLKSFLKIINEFEYSHSEKLGDAFEFLLSILGSQGDAGQFRTPRHIIDFMVAIMDPKKHEIMLDPACGTAGFLISSYKHIIKQNSSNYTPDKDPGIAGNGTQSVNEVIITSNGYSGDKLTANERSVLADNMHGYDISPDMVRLSLVNMYLHGIKEPQIFEYDSLTSEDYWHQYSDVILANPPFMSPKGGIRPHKRFSVQSNRSEVLFVDYIAEHLTPDGRAAVIVPEGIIFQSGKAYRQLRKMLVEKYLIGVISLPAGVFNPYSGVKTSILWLDKSLAKKTDKILFVKIENDGFDLGAQRRAIKKNDLPDALQKISDYKNQISLGKMADFESETKVSLVAKSEISGNGDYNLSGERYRIKEIISSKFKSIPLGDIVEIYDRLRKPITQGDRIPGQYPYYGATGILDYVHDYIFSERLVLVGEDGAKWDRNEKTAFIAEGKYWVNNHAHVLKPIKELCIDTYLVEVLNFMDLTPFITGVTVPKLNQAKLREIQIPLPPLSIQEEIVAEIESYQKIIDGARQVVENYKPRIDIDPEWKMVALEDVCVIARGGSPRPINDYITDSKDGINWIKIGDVKEGEKYIYSTKEKIKPEGITKTRLVKEGDFILSNSMSFGRPYILKISGAIHDGWLLIRIKNESLDQDYLYYILGSSSTQSQFKQGATGGVVLNLNSELVRKVKIPLPSVETQRRIADTMEQETDLVESNKHLIKIFEQKIKDRIGKVWGE